MADSGIGLNSTSTLDVSCCDGEKPKNRLDSPDSKPPANHVAGSGRGATGSDIGPTRSAPDLPDGSTTSIGVGGGQATGAGGGDDDKGKGDEFEGNDAGFCERDEDDEEADAVWKAIVERMNLRKRKAQFIEEMEKFRASKHRVTEQFPDLKRKSDSSLAEECESIPEIGSEISDTVDAEIGASGH